MVSLNIVLCTVKSVGDAEFLEYSSNVARSLFLASETTPLSLDVLAQAMTAVANSDCKMYPNFKDVKM